MEETKQKYEEYLNGKRYIFDLVGENSYLCFSVKKKNIYIEGNKEGLLTLAKHLIDFAYDEGEIYPGEMRLYPNIDENYNMDPLTCYSNDVYIKKIEKTEQETKKRRNLFANFKRKNR